MSKHLPGFGAAVAVAAVLTLPFSVLAAHASPVYHRAQASSGTITVGDTETPDTLNPTQADFDIDSLIDNAIFEGLFSYNHHGHIFAQLAARVPSVKNGGIRSGGKTWEIDLRPGERWSNGAILTSADIKFSWQAAMSPVSGPWCLGTCDVIKQIQTPSKYRAVFQLRRVYSAALDYAINGFPLIPRSWPGSWSSGNVRAAAAKLYLDQSFNYQSAKFPTNGPYQVASFGAQSVVLKPMKYFKSGAPLKTLRFRFYPSRDAMVSAAAKHKVAVTTNYNLSDTGYLRSHSSFKTNVSPNFQLEHLELNTDSRYNGTANPLHSANVRQALALSVKKTQVVRKGLHVSKAAARHLEAWTPLVTVPAFHVKQPYVDTAINGQWDPIAKRYVQPGTGQALKDAHKLLSVTRWPKGFALAAVTTAGDAYRERELIAVSSSWAALGVHLSITPVTPGQLFTHTWSDQGLLDHGKFQVADFSYFGKPDPDQFKFNLVSTYCDRRQKSHSVINGNDSCIHDRLIDTAFAKAAGTLNTSKRAYWYDRMQVELNKMAYWIPLYYGVGVYTVDGKPRNVSSNPTQVGLTWNIYDWKVS
ncbi:MAG: ABC transporter substrate-binding protein [Chloroflexota bacterium]